MGRLIYSTIMSVDGYQADERGDFDWAEPDEEVHSFVNELERGVGTYLYGRRMYETMSAWEDADAIAEYPDYVREYGEIWRAADKIVYSTTLDEATTARTRIERDLDPDAVRRMKADRDLSIGGPGLAAHAFEAGLVDECHLFIAPVVVGGGTAALPRRAQLELLDQGSFENGTVHLHYRVHSG